MISEKMTAYIATEYAAVMDFLDLMSLLNVSERTVYRIIEDGDIPAWKDEDGWNFLRDDVIKYLAKQGNV